VNRGGNKMHTAQGRKQNVVEQEHGVSGVLRCIR
jgi:hypothetical protein